jgi:Bacterial Ig domain/Bacterial Ig-like domain
MPKPVSKPVSKTKNSVTPRVGTWSALALSLLAVPSFSADIDVLIIGSTTDSTADGAVSGTSSAFDPTAVRTYLQSILAGAGVGTVNVALENRGYPYDLAAWFHYPTPADVETTTRWPNLRGEKGTDWDYVVVIGDAYSMEYMPGLYAHGVAMIAQEVAKGGAETVLLMPWPGKTSTSSVAHYKEIVYRTGRSGGYKVAPAALAWQASGLPTGTTHPTADGAFIAASSIYSAIWNKSASTSTYVYKDNLADTAHTTFVANNTATQYTGKFTFQNPFLMLGDKRRDVHFSEKGTSTEQDFKNSVIEAMGRARVTNTNSSYSDKYSSNTPADDGKGWPTANAMPIAWNHGRKFSELGKEYVVNPAYWQLGMGFMYQNNTWSSTVAAANDTHLGQIFSSEIYLANFMKGQDNTARLIPWRLIWAQMHKYNSTLNPLRDGSGPHLNVDLHKSVGTYMYTLYSGRCPLDAQPSPMTTTWFAQKTGYETAWRLGRCQTRAPGFKVMPSAATQKTIPGGGSEIMSVQFILPPTSNVTVNMSLSNPAVATLDKSTLTFTPSNYATPQTVTVTASTSVTADQLFNVQFATVSSDEVYHQLDDAWSYTAKASTLPSVAWTSAGQASVNESGTLTVTAQLSATSTSSVTIPFTVTGTSDSADRTISASPITITAGNTTGSATITITGDTTDEVNETVILTMGTPTNANKGATTVHTATITDDDGAPPANVPPTVSITAPDGSDIFAAPADIAVSATANDSDGTVTKVEFLVDGIVKATDLTLPYTYAWNAVTAGTYQLTARVTDNSGAITTSAVINVTVEDDTALPPAKPAIPTVAGNGTSTPMLSGVTEPGATVHIVVNGSEIGQATAGSGGAWSYTLSGLAAGTHAVTVSAENAGGNSPLSDPLTVTIVSGGGTTPAKPATPTATGDGTSTPTLSGVTDPAATVHIMVDGIEVGQVTAGSDGSWSYVLSGLSAGAHSVTVVAENNAGNSPASSPLNVTVAASGGGGDASSGGGSGGGCGLGAVSSLMLLMLMLMTRFARQR